jgi:hypothetical protein
MITDFRAHTATALRAEATSVRPRDGAIAELLSGIAEAMTAGRAAEARYLADAIEPRSLAELQILRRSRWWGLLEVVRNVLVFTPIAVTWYGLSVASDAYGKLLAARPDLATRPFLQLWQDGFAGAAGVMTFSTVAAIDAGLIGVLIVLSLLVHARAELQEDAMRERVALAESRIRALLARAVALADGTDIDGGRLLDELAAEERRIYERAGEREEQLVAVEAAVHELKATVARLAVAVEAIPSRIDQADATPRRLAS